MKRSIFYFGVLLIISIFLAIYYLVHLYPSQNSLPTYEICGNNWTLVLQWNFKDGLYPNGWGWGNWSLVDKSLEGRDPKGDISVYFFPFTHGEDFILETKVKFVKGTNDRDVEAQLLTRDSKKIHFESGMVLFAKENKVTVRHMADKNEYIYKTFSINMSIEYGKWYIMRFMIINGYVKAFINGVEVYASNDRFPAGNYHEPHLAVRYGAARFEYVKIYILA